MGPISVIHRILLSTLLLVSCLGPGLAFGQSSGAREYPYPRHLARISPFKLGYEYLSVRNAQSAAYWAAGVQTGILPNWYVGPLEPPQMFFPGLWVERGYRQFLPQGHFWDLVPHVRWVYMEWTQAHPTLDIPQGYWEGQGVTVGMKGLYAWPMQPVQALGRSWDWYVYGGLGLSVNGRYQRNYLRYQEATGQYTTFQTWNTTVLPGITAHLGVRLGTGR